MPAAIDTDDYIAGSIDKSIYAGSECTSKSAARIGERECLHVFNATKHAHVTESANLLLERIWSVEDQDLLMVF
jgi:hypothetical protein